MLGFISSLYGKVINRRNRRYDEHRRAAVKVTVPVISVGNVSVGGTGKTPMVMFIAELLQSAGYSPGIILRGYRRSSRGLRVVHDGTNIAGTAKEVGDEAMLHATRLDIPVVVAESKVDAAVYAAGFLPCDVLIVDDGFQHRALHRDLDIVLVNRKTLDDQRLLPAGRLREPLTSLNRADVVIASGGSITRDELAVFTKPDAVIARMQISADAPLLREKRLLAFAGIANPDRFIDTLKACGVDVVSNIEFRDHHVYGKSDIEKIISLASKLGADVVTTEKDAVKLLPAKTLFERAGITMHVLSITARITDGFQVLESKIIATVKDFKE